MTSTLRGCEVVCFRPLCQSRAASWLWHVLLFAPKSSLCWRRAHGLSHPFRRDWVRRSRACYSTAKVRHRSPSTKRKRSRNPRFSICLSRARCYRLSCLNVVNLVGEEVSRARRWQEVKEEGEVTKPKRTTPVLLLATIASAMIRQPSPALQIAHESAKTSTHT